MNWLLQWALMERYMLLVDMEAKQILKMNVIYNKKVI